MGWQLDGSFGYSFFRANESVETRQSHERVVDYSADAPSVTAIQNMAQGTIPNVVGTPRTPSPTPSVTVANTTTRFAPQGQPRTVGTTGGATGRPRGNVSDLISRFGGS